MLNLLEELLLLALDDEKGKIISSSSLALPYGLSGAILLEFSLAGKILVEDKRLIIIDNTLTGNEILDKALDIIDSSPKQKSVKYWVSKLERKMKGLKRDILSQLIKRGILTETENRFLWVIPTKRYPTNNPEPENQVRKRIKAIVLDGEASDERSELLISLINSCSLVNEIFCKDERKVAKKRIKEIVESEKVGESITDTINEIIMAVIIGAVVTSSVASSN